MLLPTIVKVSFCWIGLLTPVLADGPNTPPKDYCCKNAMQACHEQGASGCVKQNGLAICVDNTGEKGSCERKDVCSGFLYSWQRHGYVEMMRLLPHVY